MSRLPAWVSSLRPARGTLRQDAVAGVPGAIASVPDGMASAVLVGVNPVYGLYASMAGPIGGGLAVRAAVDGGHHHHRRGSGGRLRVGQLLGR